MGQLRLPGQILNYTGPNLTPRRPNPKPWGQRINWTWTRTKEAPPVPPGVEWWWKRIQDWGRFDNRLNVFEPYRRPIMDATGGGQLYARQLPPFHPNSVYNQTNINVAITADGSELTGQFSVLPLVNTTTQNGTAANEVVSVTQSNGVTNITLGNTTNG